MTYRPNRRDLHATLIAATATLLTILLNGPFPPIAAPRPGLDNSPAMRGLIPASEARAEGAWLLGEREEAPEVRLSFAPQYERLVWRVDGESADVLLDAATGEALEFEFE